MSMPSASGSATRAVARESTVAQSDYRRGRGHFGVCLFSRSAGSEGRDSDVACGGQYEASWKVASLQSVDKTTPATNLKQDASGTTLACIAADGTIDPALFAEDGDSCSANNPYVRTAHRPRPHLQARGHKRRGSTVGERQFQGRYPGRASARRPTSAARATMRRRAP